MGYVDRDGDRYSLNVIIADDNRELKEEEMKIFGKFNPFDVLVFIFFIWVVGGGTLNFLHLRSKMADQDARENQIRAQGKVRTEVVAEINAQQGKQMADLGIWIEGYKAGYKAK